MKAVAIDLFCGIGGLSYGLKKAGIPVAAGVDLDNSCKYAYEENTKGEFIAEDISKLNGHELKTKYWKDKGVYKILVGCAPCQPFSSHSNKNKNKKRSSKWRLLNEFSRLISETKADVVSMENVPNLSNQKIFEDFVNLLKERKYHVSYSNVYCPDYGIPQKRRRLVLLASKLGEINLIPQTHTPKEFVTIKQVIGKLPKVDSGEICKNDPLHRTTLLTELNLKRIRASKPNGTWEDWDEELMLECHKKDSGTTYKSVYGRMSWDEPSPTITTQFYNFGVNAPREAVEKAISDSINSNSPDLGIKSVVDSNKKKVLISQTKTDKPLSDVIYSMLIFNNVPAEDILYTNCDDEISRVPDGYPVYKYLRDFFVESYSTQRIYVLFVTSDNFKKSWGAITEVGAAWITQIDNKIFNIIPGRPEHPLDDEAEWHNTNKDGAPHFELWMTKLDVDIFCVKVENMCDKLGYAKKSRDANKNYLGTLVQIR